MCFFLFTHLLSSEEEKLMDGQKRRHGSGPWRASQCFLAHLSFFRPCSADAITRAHKHTLTKKHSQLALVSHAACMWITGSPIVLPSFNRSLAATWKDVYVAKLQTAKCVHNSSQWNHALKQKVCRTKASEQFIHNHFIKYKTTVKHKLYCSYIKSNDAHCLRFWLCDDG